nr:hypothetical protein [Streptomyces sp. b94]
MEGLDNVDVADGSGGWLRHRYRHTVIDEGRSRWPAHWKMLRALLGDETYDDLDGSSETPAGYRSVLRGASPSSAPSHLRIPDG